MKTDIYEGKLVFLTYCEEEVLLGLIMCCWDPGYLEFWELIVVVFLYVGGMEEF